MNGHNQNEIDFLIAIIGFVTGWFVGVIMETIASSGLCPHCNRNVKK